MITETRRGLTALAALTLFIVLTGELFPNVLGVPGAIVLWAVTTGLAAVAITKLGGWAKLRPSLLPKSLALFLLLAVLSIAWASNRGPAAFSVGAMLALFIGGIFLATTFSWPALVALLGRSTRLVVGLSLTFELSTAIFVRQGIRPVAGLSAGSEISLSNLFSGGPILGIAGSADALGAVAALALVILWLQWASGTISRRRMLGWGIVIAGVLLLSGSWAAAASLGVTGVALGLILLARRRAEGQRGSVAIVAGVLALAGATALLTATGLWPMLPSGLAAMSPAGLVLLLAIIVSAAYRSWWLAADRQRDAAGDPLSFEAATLLPLLLVVFATCQVMAGTSFETGAGLSLSWLLLVLVTVKSKQDAHSVALPLAAVSGRYRDRPLPGRQR